MPATKTSPVLPTMKQAQVLARSLANRLAHQPGDVDDLAQEGLWTWSKRVKRKPVPIKPFALARTVMQRAMFSYYSGRLMASGARYREDVSMETICVDPSDNPCTDWDDRLDTKEYLNALEEECGVPARYVAENLLMPRDLFYCRYLDDTARVKGKKHVRPSHQQLRAVAALSYLEWQTLLKEIREFTSMWLLLVSEEEELPLKVLKCLP